MPTSTEPLQRKRGRPPGSVGLTPDRRATILALIRSGTPPEDAAGAAGVPARTFREWRARGAGRSKRPATPELKSFERDVKQAFAEANASAKARVHQRNPEKWLDRNGWRETNGDAPVPTSEEIKTLAVALIAEALYLDPTVTLPRCPSPRCRCRWHRERTDEELQETKAMARKKRRRRST